MDYLWKVSSKAKEMLTQKDSSAVAEDVNKPESSSSFTAGLENENPISSQNIETEQVISDKEISPENKNVDSEPDAIPVSEESDSNFEAGDGSNAKTGISAGDLKDVSYKAVESAKSVGSFLYGFAGKTTRTLTKTAKQLKTTVEENTILGDFNKEQKEFTSSKNSKSIDECQPPWIGTDDEENVKQQILSLSADRRNFLRSPPTGVKFDFDFENMYPVAETMLKEDPALEKMRFEIVPKLIKEENFWINYFYRVSLVKQSSLISKKSSSGDSSGSNSEKSTPDSTEGLDKTAGYSNEGFVESDSADSPNHEFVSDSFQSSRVSEEDIKHGMKMLGVTEKSSMDEWEKEMQQELQEYEVVAEGNEDPDWENEIEQMLDDKVKNVA